MAHAKKCDSCGKVDTHDEEEARPSGWALVEITQADPKMSNRESIWQTDLCPECAVTVHKSLGNVEYPTP